MPAASTATILCLLAATIHPPALQASMRSGLPGNRNIASVPAPAQLPRYLTADDIGNLGTEACWQIYMPEAAYRADQWNEQEARRLGRKEDLAALQAINSTYALVPNDKRNDGMSKQEPAFVHRRIGNAPLTAAQTARLDESRRASESAPRLLTAEDIRTIMNSPELPDAQAAKLIVLWNKLETARCAKHSAQSSTPSSPRP